MFAYQFPFEDAKPGFLISPKKTVTDEELNRTISVDYPKQLPLQFDLQAP